MSRSNSASNLRSYLSAANTDRVGKTLARMGLVRWSDLDDHLPGRVACIGESGGCSCAADAGACPSGTTASSKASDMDACCKIAFPADGSSMKFAETITRIEGETGWIPAGHVVNAVGFPADAKIISAVADSDASTVSIEVEDEHGRASVTLHVPSGIAFRRAD